MENFSDNKEKKAKNTIDNEEKKVENILILNNKENYEKKDNTEEKNEIQNREQININEKESERKQEHQNEKIEFTKKIGNYVLFDQIGKGTFSKVTKAIHILTSQQVAVKILDKEKIEDEIDLERIFREIEILKNIHHPNIVQMYETYSTIHNFYLMMEFVSGGDLFDYISDNSYLSENLSCHFFRQLIGVLEYLMLMGITHRDIKPENILLDEKHKNIKVIDFGLSNYCENDEFLSSSCGSPCYASPEMLSGKPYHGDKTDIWSAGIVLYSMLVGSLPFDNQELYNLYEQIRKGKFYLPSTLSLEAIDLLKRILQVDPKKRIGIEEIKKHPWFNMEKNPIYKGINISKEKFPCNKDVVEFIYENFFIDEKEINIDKIIEMVESHACNKYTSTYYLTKIYILGIEDELIMLNDYNKEEKKEDTQNNNNIINFNNLNNNKVKKDINEINNNEDIKILKHKERKLYKSLSKDILENKYNDLKNNILGILNEKENYDIEKPSTNIGLNKKENNYIEKNKCCNNNNQNINEIENISKNENNINIRKENNRIKIIENEDLKNEDYINENKNKYYNINNKKNQKIINKRNNKILYISLADKNKLDSAREKKISQNNTEYNNILNYNITYNKDCYNKINLELQKLKIKTNNNSCNRAKKIDKLNNKKINSKNKNNISQNNNLSERFDKNKIACFKKINEFNQNLIQLKPLPKGNSNFNFYVINNIINKDKYYVHKKIDILDSHNKRIIKEKIHPNEIKTNKKIFKRNIDKSQNKEKEDKSQHISNIFPKQKNGDKKKNHHIKIKSEQDLTSFSLSSQIKMGKKINKNEVQKKINKIKVNLKSNNTLFCNKSPQRTIDINTYRKDFKKIIPKLKLENINNKVNNFNQKKHIKETNNLFNKAAIKNYYSYYTQNIMNIKDNTKQNSINNRSDSIFNGNKEIKNSKIYKRKINKKITILNRNNLRRMNSFNKETKIFTHQRNLTCTSKTKLSNLKTENNSMINSNKISFITKDNMDSNKKNKVLKNINNSINISTYMNDFFAKNLKKRNNYIIKSQENFIK